MKKKKTLSLLMLAFAAVGMVSCGDTTSTAHTHEFKNVDDSRNVAATCSEAGRQVQKCDCGEEKVVNVAKLKHNYVDDSARNKEATCTESGVANAKKCSVCGNETQTVISALGHEWVDDEDQSGVTQATCTEAGQSKQHCSREGCNETQTAEIAALGHTWGEFEITNQPTCTEAGEQKHTCSVCETVATEPIAALGHDFQLVGEQVDPTPGKATVRVYSCVHEGCDETNLGFKATEVTEESKEHLRFEPEEGGEGVEQGARFWGRPIGNAVELDVNGTADSNNHEPVFDENETGDFFEYVFDLTEKQAEQLDNCRLYCDAKPANYLNGKDFWAADGGEEWTPGMYIEGDKKGQTIDDYRYILYVDGEVKEFDPNIKAPVTGSNPQDLPRGEYVMPYTFKLHSGTNRISLRMAGGYRSLFYNFIFRAVEEPSTPPVEEHKHSFTAEGAKVGDLQPLSCTCDTVAYDLDHNGVKIKADKTWDITGITAGEYEIYLDGHASNGNGGSNFTGEQVKAGHDSRYAFQVGENAEVYITDNSTYSEFGWSTGGNGDNGNASISKYTVKPVANITIPDGATEFKMNWHGDGYSAYIFHVRLVKVVAE